MSTDTPKTPPADLSSASPEATAKDLHTTLAALEELHKKATPGTWKSAPTPEYKLLAEGYHFSTPYEIADDASTVAVVTKYGGLEKAHADFIAALRNAFPDLSQWIRKLVAERDAANNEVGGYEDQVNVLCELLGIDELAEVEPLFRRLSADIDRHIDQNASQAAEIDELRKDRDRLRLIDRPPQPCPECHKHWPHEKWCSVDAARLPKEKK